MVSALSACLRLAPGQVILRDVEPRLSHNTAAAVLLAYLAEIDARHLYLEAAYPSMFAYCAGQLHLSDDMILKRLQAARVARQFPVLFDALADGRLHLSAVCLLAPHLMAGNVDRLVAAAAHKTKSEIEGVLAACFPRTEVMPLVETLPASSPEHAPAHVQEVKGEHAPGHVQVPRSNGQPAPGQVESQVSEHAPGHVHVPRSKVAPLAQQRFVVQVSIGQSTHDKLRYAQELLGHQVPTGDLAEVLDRAIDALIAKLEKQKFAATDRPRAVRQRSSKDPRHIPAHVRRAVHERDGGQCTFVSKGWDPLESTCRHASLSIL